MNRPPLIRAIFSFFMFIPFGYAAADIAPDPMTAGKLLTDYEGESKEVRMVEENVFVRVCEDKIITVDDACADDAIIPGDFAKIEHSTIATDSGLEARCAGRFHLAKKAPRTTSKCFSPLFFSILLSNEFTVNAVIRRSRTFRPSIFQN
jgi:hypothetical protein